MTLLPDYSASTHAGTPDLLTAVVGATRVAVAERRKLIPNGQLEREAAARTPRAEEFRAALARSEGFNVIAECKRRSPVRGILQKDYDPAALARVYARAGAAAISVLTEPSFFDGSVEHLKSVRDAVDLPILRKEFVVTEYQLIEARAAGADAALLIVAALEDNILASLLASVEALGLAALVEVHDEMELERAVGAGAGIIGVNNRNLRTLEIGLETTARLIERMPGDVIAIAESGLRTHRDLVRLRDAGYHGFLIGEVLVTDSAPGRALEALREG
ncbi:MAG: indole-3-glycerol phosphate synthase [Acidobacteria bacterium]|nr:indole-3-glycerol phosphate synthase [Acidobacteriota bacterium]|tara:strand:+ start:1315 stop:2142 length:828 start_codon:yes stop_codon:yes gene_type:complete